MWNKVHLTPLWDFTKGESLYVVHENATKVQNRQMVEKYLVNTSHNRPIEEILLYFTKWIYITVLF